MRMVIAAMGKAKPSPEQTLLDTYRGRFDAIARPLGLKPLDLAECDDRRAAGSGDAKRREADLLTAAVPDGARLIALDEHGRNLTSQDLAALIARWRDEGAPACAFLIGGADGLDPALADRADRKLAFGAATWPHMLVRAMLAEQIYRAATILAGHPYHRA